MAKEKTRFMAIVKGKEKNGLVKRPKKVENLEDEIRKDLEKLFGNIDKDFKKYVGMTCPEFDTGCIVCRMNLIYNKFKKEVYDEMLVVRVA